MVFAAQSHTDRHRFGGLGSPFPHVNISNQILHSLAEHAKSAERGEGNDIGGVVASPFGWIQGEFRKGVVQGILASALLACSARGNEMFRCRG